MNLQRGALTRRVEQLVQDGWNTPAIVSMTGCQRVYVSVVRGRLRRKEGALLHLRTNEPEEAPLSYERDESIPPYAPFRRFPDEWPHLTLDAAGVIVWSGERAFWASNRLETWHGHMHWRTGRHGLGERICAWGTLWIPVPCQAWEQCEDCHPMNKEAEDARRIGPSDDDFRRWNAPADQGGVESLPGHQRGKNDE